MKDLYPIIVVTPIVGLGVYCISQVALARMSPGRSPYRSLSLGFLCGLATVFLVAAWALLRMEISMRDRFGFVILDAITYLALAFGYFNFVNLTVASLRIRLLEELGESGGTLDRGQLLARHSSEKVIAIRLERLVRGGHLVEKNNRLFSGRLVFLTVARIFDSLRWAIIGRQKPGG